MEKVKRGPQIETYSKDDLCEEACREYDYYNSCPIQKAIRELAEYKDLEKQNRLLKLPCTIGSVVWINSVDYGVVECKVGSVKIRIDDTIIFFGSALVPWQSWDCAYPDREDAYWYLSDFGRSVFSTRQEAKNAPEKRELWHIATGSEDDCDVIE